MFSICSHLGGLSADRDGQAGLEDWEKRNLLTIFAQFQAFTVRCENIRASDTWLHSLPLPRRGGILKHLRFHHVNLNHTLSQWSRFFFFFYSPWWEYQHMAIRHNPQLQSGYLFSAQYYLTNNYSVYSIKLRNLHNWQQTRQPADEWETQKNNQNKKWVDILQLLPLNREKKKRQKHTQGCVCCRGGAGTRWRWAGEISLGLRRRGGGRRSRCRR